MIKIENVSFSYSNESEDNKVLQNINLEIKSGEFVAILGHNGSGKSTLAKLFNAVLLPNSGKVYIDGIDSSIEEKIFDIRQTVGMVFQNPDNQIVSTIVEEDVAFGLENLGVDPLEIRKRVDEALKEVNMYEFRKSAPHLLSGGQKQRVAIAGVIAMKPKYIVFDESTAMLDPLGREEVLAAIQKLNREHNITTILITHYMDEAVKADRAIVIDHGKIIMDAAPREIFSQVEKLKAVGLDVPQVTELAYELNKCGVNIRTDILHSSEAAEELIRVLGGAK